MSGGRDGRFDRTRATADLAAAIVLILLPAAARAAGGGGALTGRVTDGDARAPIAAVRLTLEPQLASSPASLRARRIDRRFALTDDQGAYAFEEVPPGTYVLILESAPRPSRDVAAVRIEAGAEVRLDFDLQTSPSERIVVRGAREDEGTGLSLSVVGRDAFESRPAALGDPFRALAGRAGIAQGNDFQSEMRVRGGDASETTVLLDGQPLPYAYHFAGAAGSAGTLNGDLLEAVSVSTGGFSAEYGDALAGVIDLSSREAPPGRMTGTAGIGSMLAHAALFGPAKGGSYVLSARYSDLALYDGRVAGDGTDDVRLQDLFGALRAPLAGKGKLEIAYLGAANDYHAALGYSGSAALSSASSGLRGRLEIPIDPRTLVRVQTAASSLSVGSSVTDGMSFVERQKRRELRVSVLRLLGARHRLNGGWASERLRGEMTGTVQDGDLLAPATSGDREDQTSIFLEDTWGAADRVTVRYGARVDRSNRTGEGALSPRLSLEVRPRDGILLRCAAGRFAQFPRQEQLFLAAGERLRTQVADHLIAGVELSSAAGTRVVIEAYRKMLTDPVGETVNRYVDLPETVERFDRGLARGAELTVRRRSGSPWVWEMNYAWLRTTQSRDGIVSPRNGDQRHALALSSDWSLGRGWETGAIFRYASGRPYSPLRPWTDGVDYGLAPGGLNEARLPAYARMDLRLARSIPAARGTLKFHLDILNVLNRVNVRSIELSFDPSTTQFYRTTRYQSPVLPVFGISAEF